LSKQSHVIAANLDASALVVTLLAPRVSYGFIDRFLLTCEAYDVPAWLILNKTDLYDGHEMLEELAGEMISIYDPLGYEVLPASAHTGEGMNQIREKLANKRTLFSGHSGVGKSTLVNAIEPGLGLKTGIISDYSMKGKHTTTFAEMFELQAGGFIIDTPGIKELGIVDIEPAVVGHFFPEIKETLPNCKFHNCMHISEPGCAVRQAAEDGSIAPSRYASYLSIVANEDQYN
jgi:ribosome biogenesis GTPase